MRLPDTLLLAVTHLFLCRSKSTLRGATQDTWAARPDLVDASVTAASHVLGSPHAVPEAGWRVPPLLLIVGRFEAFTYRKLHPARRDERARRRKRLRLVAPWLRS